MPTWGEILVELRESAAQRGGNPDFDSVRRKYLALLHQKTGRSIILYATDWLAGGTPMSSITLEDMQGLMEVCRGLPGPELDIILHSPGGSAEATASIVRYLRTKYTDIRVFVPLAAMSAGTMWALSADRVVMGKHSQLGPIDPQFLRPQEGRYAPARAIVRQLEKIIEECQRDPSLMGAYYPILQQYGTSLIEECEAAENLAKKLVREWLCTYMLVARDDREAKAEELASWFADYTEHQSHGLGISREAARDHGVVIEDLEDDQELQDLVLSVFHSTMHTFAGPAAKIVENHFGRAFVKVQQQVAVPAMIQQQGIPPFAAPPQPG